MPPDEDDDWDFGDANAKASADAAPLPVAPTADDDEWAFGDANAKETPNAPGVPSDEPPKPMGPPPPPQIESRPTRTPEAPSVLDELGRSAASYVQGASANLMDELLGAGNYLGGKVGLRPEVTWDEAQSEAGATVRPMVRDYPAGQIAGQTTLGIATSPLGGPRVAGQALIGGLVSGGSEYADSRDPMRTAVMTGVGAAGSALGAWGGNKLGKWFGLTPTEATERELAEAAAQARLRPTPQPEPLGPLPAIEEPLHRPPVPAPDAPAYPPPYEPPIELAQPKPSVRPPPPQYPPDTPLYGPFAEGPRPLDLPEPSAVPYQPTPAPTPASVPPPQPVPPGAAQDPFAGRLGELARTPPEPLPPDLMPGPARDPFHGRLGELARTAPEPAAPPSPAPAVTAPPLGGHTWPKSLTPEERAIADAFREAAARVGPAGKFHDRVFIGGVLDQLPAETREAVRAALPSLQKKGALKMSRADLVGAMDPAMVKSSEVVRPGTQAKFHLIDPEALGISSAGGKAPPPPAPPPRPAPPADASLEDLLRMSVDEVATKGKPSPKGAPAVGARKPAPPAVPPAEMPLVELAEAPPRAATRVWQPPPEDIPLELAESVPQRARPEWMEPPARPEWSLEPMGAPGSGPRRGAPPVEASFDPTYQLGAVEEGAYSPGTRARGVDPTFAESTYRAGDIESGAREAAKRGASPRGNAARAFWDEPAPYEVGNPDLSPAPAAPPQDPRVLRAERAAKIAIERQKATAPETSVGEKVIDKGLYGLGWVPGIGKYARIGRAGLQAAQAARGAGPADVVKLVENARARQAVQSIAYAGAPTLNYAMKSVLADEASGLAPTDRQKLNSAVLSGDQKLTNAVDYVMAQGNAAYMSAREKALKRANTEE